MRGEAAIALLDVSEDEALPILTRLLAWGLDERGAEGRVPLEAAFVTRLVKDVLCVRFKVRMLDIESHFLGRPPAI